MVKVGSFIKKSNQKIKEKIEFIFETSKASSYTAGLEDS
jgi:hypothetical protein